jgi:putative Mn2+ efflux pump MntP
VHIGPVVLLLFAAVAVAFVHSILPDHWVPLAVVGRTQRWSLGRVARVSALASGGHVVASLLLAGLIALVGLRFQQQLEAQQGHLVGAVLVLAGLAFLVWGLVDRSRDHGQHDGHGYHDHGPHGHSHDEHDHEPHEHEHEEALEVAAVHEHGHHHGAVLHSHVHDHEAFIRARQQELSERSRQRSLLGLLATSAVPFGVAASPDLTILPVALAASAFGAGTVLSVLGLFAVVTMGTFVGLTVAATVAGYQVKGEWLERHANTITALVLIGIGVVAYVGL